MLPAELYCSKAEEVCRSLGSYLTSIHSESENDFIANFVKEKMDYKANNYNVWIGIVSTMDNLNYHWLDGTNYNYTSWYSEPSPSVSNCGYLQTSDKKWRVTNYSYNYYSICSHYLN